MAAQRSNLLFFSPVLSCVCATLFAAPLTRSIEQNRQTHGVVLFDVDWGVTGRAADIRTPNSRSWV